jgi:carbon-monoxide dehydrogenase medium subunit
MIPAEFAYHRPASLGDALALLSEHGAEAKVLAGGHSLLPLLRLRVASTDRIIDIGRLAELKGVRPLRDGSYEIGGLTTYTELLSAVPWPWVKEAIEGIGDVQVRNRGTIGGAIAHADPASDMPAIVLALGGEMELQSSSGKRSVSVDDFFLGPFETAIRPDEILVAIRGLGLPMGASGAYRRIEQPASGYSLVGVAAVVAMDDGKATHVRVGVTGVAEAAYRAKAVESALLGGDGGTAAVAAAAEHAADGVEVNSDIHADATYRSAMAKIITRRTLEAALGR